MKSLGWEFTTACKIKILLLEKSIRDKIIVNIVCYSKRKLRKASGNICL